MTTLFRVELRRALSRRMVRVLIALAVAASVAAGLLVFLNTESFDAAAQARAHGQFESDVTECVLSGRPEGSCRGQDWVATHDESIHVTDLWPQEGGDAILSIAVLLLVFGAMLAAASLGGADWKSGMLGTLLTWEPRRVRLTGVRISVAAIAAATIALLLQVVLIVALLPAMLAHGGADGVDRVWLLSLFGGMGKGAVLTAFAAITGASLALIGRNTAVALGCVFFYLNVAEPALRAWKPGLSRWLVTENAGVFFAGHQDNLSASPFPVVTLTVYAVILAATAATVLRRRDVGH